MLTKSLWRPKGTYPWKGHKKVIKVLGEHTFLLDDKQIWRVNQIKKCVRDSLAPDPEQWIEQDTAPQPQTTPSPLRQSTRRKRDPGSTTTSTAATEFLTPAPPDAGDR